MNNSNKKIRTVKVNDRGQIVIPEDVRRDFGISGSTVLVMVEKGDELVLKRESEVFEALEDRFWKRLSGASLRRAWGSEDEVWDKIAKKI